MRRDLAVAVFLVVFGGAVAAYALATIEAGVRTDVLGPAAFPVALGAGIALCGLLSAVGIPLGRAGLVAAVPLAELAPYQDGDEPAGLPARARLLGAACATAAYVLAFEPLGYLLATPPYIAAMLLVHGGASRRAFALAPIVVTLALYGSFRLGLQVPVPGGVLEALLPR